MNEIAKRISRLSPAKQALLDRMLRESSGGLPPQTAILKRQNQGPAPLSFAQERFWFLHQFESDNVFFNRPAAFRLTGPINAVLLERSLNEIVRRHEMLRTTFEVAGEQPVQIIAPDLVLPMSLVELMHPDKPGREKEAMRLMNEELQQPFDLSKGPLLRLTLFHLGDEEHILFLVVHHIIFDGWSEGIFLEELTTIYESFSAGNPCPLPDLPVQFADYAQWQRNRMNEETLKPHKAYWKQRLDGAPPIFTLPADRARPQVRTYRGSKHTILLTRELSEGLKALSRKEGATLFMVLLAAFKILLYRYTGQYDVIIGTAIANRTNTEIEEMIGFFVNTLVLRTDLRGNPTFQELLGRIREMVLGAYAHQDLPFEMLVEEAHPERNLSYSPLCQIMVDMEIVPKQTSAIKNVNIEEININSGTSHFDLTLEIFDKEHGLRCDLIYNSDLFDDATIERMAAHYQRLLEGIIENPDQRLSELPLLTDAERHRILVEWNNTTTEYSRDKCIHQLFEEQVERTPDAVAVIFEDRQLTYRELNSSANQLAHYLRKQGVGPEVLVGICVERSLEMIVGILGILKAGGAYVPLDPAYPVGRLKLMFEDINSSLLLTQERLSKELRFQNIKVVLLDTGWDEISLERDENLPQLTLPDNAVYVIYTSGSTGRPKGVVVEHTSLVNYTRAAIAQYGIKPADRILQFASISFDASAEEIYPCLAQGATILLRNDDMLNSASDFFHKCAEWKLTVLCLPTAYWHKLTTDIDAENAGLPEAVRLVIIGGEKALSERLAIWHRRVGPKVRLLNTYGPTEATVVTSMCDLTQPGSGDVTAQRIPIGRPLPNVQIYILDSFLQPVPAGIAGELHIGGNGLAREYLNSKELTSEKFIPNPFSREPGERLYKTGDLGRYLPDGNIEFLGRIDSQVKIRGFRIELGEIEAVLGQHPSVREAVVAAGEDQTGDKQLVAYVVPDQKSIVSNSELRSFLSVRLPDYMIPSAFVMMDALPLTTSDKIDRKALPEPYPGRPDLETAFVKPRTPIEEILAGIWCEVLGLKEVGVHDNFFELGGHSLLATQVMSRLRKAFQVEMPLRSLFEMPTIAGLAIRIAQSQAQVADHKEMDRIPAELAVSDSQPASGFRELEDERYE